MWAKTLLSFRAQFHHTEWKAAGCAAKEGGSEGRGQCKDEEIELLFQAAEHYAPEKLIKITMPDDERTKEQ